MRELNVNEIDLVFGGEGTDSAGSAAKKVVGKIGFLSAIDAAFEFCIGFVEAIEDINE